MQNNTQNDGSAITIKSPEFFSLDTASSDTQKLKNSLVRIKIKNDTSESLSTGFFYRTPELLVTALHSFPPNHACRTQVECNIIIGLVQDSKTLQEKTIVAKKVLIDTEKDILFLQIDKIAELSHIQPLEDSSATHTTNDKLTVGGFYQDNPALTFTTGNKINDSSAPHLTSIIISSGFSGSPVIDRTGKVVGMVSSYRPIKNQNIGLAKYVSIH